MAKYRKKPVVIDAIQYLPSMTCQELYDWAGIARTIGHNPIPFRFADGAIFVSTLEGEMRANVGDWIIRGVKGELYPCKPEIFAATYDAAEEPAPELQRRTTTPC